MVMSTRMYAAMSSSPCRISYSVGPAAPSGAAESCSAADSAVHRFLKRGDLRAGLKQAVAHNLKIERRIHQGGDTERVDRTGVVAQDVALDLVTVLALHPVGRPVLVPHEIGRAHV